MQTRREFNTGLASLAFGGLALSACSTIRKLPDYAQRVPGYGTRAMRRLNRYELVPFADYPKLHVPAGFECRVVSRLGDPLTDGSGTVPDAADGMGAFSAGPGQVILVRNHELAKQDGGGGTTTIRYDYARGELIEQSRSLTNTIRNCSGGATPWGTWLSCEEDLSEGHGYVYEVPALHDGLTERRPLEQLGRFYHEAAAVDPVTGAIYLTEDQLDGLFYRFVPQDRRADPIGQGSLQALAFADGQGTDSRNWHRDDLIERQPRAVRWVTLGERDDPRKRGRRELGAVRFACGEGIHFGRNEQGRDEIYFTCTSGGRIKSGQVMRFVPDRADPDGGRLDLFLESTDEHAMNFSDNLTVAPNGHLIVCEDPYFGPYALRQVDKSTRAWLRGVTPDGAVYDIAQLEGSELSGACFSPDGKTLFFNVYSPATTVAMTGNWGEPLPGWTLPMARSLPRRG